MGVGVLEDSQVVLELNKDRGLVEAVKRGRAGDDPLKAGGKRGLNHLLGEEADLSGHGGELRGASHCANARTSDQEQPRFRRQNE